MSQKKNVEAIYPLSSAQQGMIIETLLAPESGIHVEQVVFENPCTADLPALENAWKQVVSRHAALRTGFIWKDGDEPLQVVFREVDAGVTLHDWSGLAEAERRERRSAYLHADRRQGFKLAKPPLMRLALCRLGADDCELAWTFHHVLMDGWSQAVLQRELFSLWRAFSRGEEPRLERPRPYQDFIRWLKRQDLARAEEYWRRRLRGFTAPTPLGIEIEPAGAPLPEERYAIQSAYLSPPETSAVRALAQSLQVTLNVLVQGVWSLLLCRYSGGRDVVFGATVSGRPPELPGIESTIGLFINTLPVRVRLPERGPARSWLKELHAHNLELRRFEHTPGGAVREWSELPGSAPMYESIVVVENYVSSPAAAPDQAPAARAVEAKGAQTKYALAMLVSLEARLGLHLVHDRLRLDDGEVARIAEHFLALLRSLAVDPGQDVADLLGQVPRGETPRVRSLRQGGKGASAASFVAPRTPLETVVAEVWAGVLGLPRVGTEDNFFELGGHSLVAFQLLGRLQKALETELPLRVLFENPTVAGMAAAVQAHRARQREEIPPEAQALPAIRPAPEKLYEPFPLTDLQQAYWIGGTGAFELASTPHVYEEVEFEDLDPERLERALERLIERHPMLRAFVTPDGRQQVLRQVPPYRIEVLDLRGWSPGEAENALRQIRERMEFSGPRPDRWPLFEVRLSRLDGRTRLHLDLSLLIVDGLTLPLFLEELLRSYRDPEALGQPLELSFRDYVLALAAEQESEPYRRAEQYWRERLATLPPPPELPLVRSPGSLPGHRLAHRGGGLEPELWRRFQAHAARAGVTPTVALCTAYAEVLATWSKSPRFTLNVLFSNRSPFHPEVSRILGNCSTTLLLEVDGSPRESFRARARRLQQQMWRDLEHSQFTGIRVLRELNRIQGGTARAAMPVVFTSALNLRRSGAAAPAAEAAAARPEVTYAGVQTPQVWLDHQVGETAGRLGFNWDSVDELFPAGLVTTLVEAYRRLLHQLARDEASWEAAAHGLLPAEQFQVRASVNATAAPVSPQLLHALFEDQVPERRHDPAVVAAGRTLSYGDLLRLSRGLAQRLRELGARPNRLIAVVMEKGWEQVVATLAVMQSGAAYLPIDPGLPVERFQYLLEQGGVEVVLTQPALRERLRCPAGVVAIPVTEEEPASEPAALEPVQGPEDLAYVIFTSGSTGLPKGVMIDHRGAVNTILDLNRRFGVGPQDRVLALSRLSFDLSVYDLFGLLAAGGAIVLPESAETREPARWAERIARERVTIWNTVPALMEMLVHDLESRSQPLPPSLSLVLLSGDWIPVTLPDRIRALGENVRVISLGGATEASIWSICHPIDRVDPAWASIPYGRPLSNQTMHVLDEALEPRPASVPGQLYIGGIGLARGYWRDEEKTRVSFLVHPRTGERLYRTGDLGRSLPDGTIEFLGREDFQVKVQGYRVELGEIEAALAEHPAVRAGVVAALGERGQRRLVAYVVLGEEADGGAPIEMTGLRAFLESKLPDYMIPSAFLRLDALPLTANGKLDRGALPAPEDRTAAREETFIGPRDETESELVRIWEELLEARPIGVRDNFFELGGHSLLAVRLTGRIRRRFGRDLPLSVLFAGGTVEHLATVLRGGPEDPARRALLVPIQTAGSKPPFFCVHPIGGSVLCYADLARRLGAEQPFYGLQAPHLDGGAEPALEKLADLYVRELRQVEPEGPYRLGGWSMGGIVAFEMARRLREQGQEVALVALIDAVLPGCGAYPESADEASLAAWFAHDLATLSGRTGDLSPANPGGESEDGGVETAQLRGLYELFGANARALLGYVPGPYAGRVVLFQAGEEPPEVRRRAGLAWRAVAADLETHILPGSHYTLVREPHVRALAERLRSLLEAAPGHLPAELPPSPARRSHDAELSLPT